MSRSAAWARVSMWVLAGLVAVLLGAGTAGAVPESAAPSSAAPSSSGAPTSDPAAPPADSGSGDGSTDIPAGTPRQGTVHWEQFGGGTTDAPTDLESFSNTMVGYALTGFGAAAVIGTLCVFLMMIVGFRGRSQVAKLAAEQSIWVWIAVMIVGSFSTIGGLLVSGGLG